jgi:hypothetical protein
MVSRKKKSPTAGLSANSRSTEPFAASASPPHRRSKPERKIARRVVPEANAKAVGFFQVWLLTELLRRANHEGYFRLAKV